MFLPDFTFTFFQRGFNGPALAGHAYQLCLRAASWCVAEEELDLCWVGQTAAQRGPQAWPPQGVTHGRHAHKGKIRLQRAATAFLDSPAVPGRARQLSGQDFQFGGPWRIG